MVHYPDSYKLGKQAEEKCLAIIQDYFKRDIVQEPDAYSKHDYSCEKYTYELKTRTNRYSAYPTTMITANKLDDGRILLFNFTDGLWFIEYNKDKFSQYERRQFSRFGANWDEKEHVFIPIGDLTQIKKY